MELKVLGHELCIGYKYTVSIIIDNDNHQSIEYFRLIFGEECENKFFKLAIDWGGEIYGEKFIVFDDKETPQRIIEELEPFLIMAKLTE